MKYTKTIIDNAVEAMAGNGVLIALAALKKAKARLPLAAEHTQDYPPSTIELGTALDTLDFAMADIIVWLSDVCIDEYIE